MNDLVADDRDAESRALRFRVVHLLYATALIASGLATFGTVGIVPALLVLGIWILVFTSRYPARTLLAACLLLLFGGCLFGLLLPSVSNAREAARRMSCMGHMKQIALALHNYHDTYDCFPPAYLTDKDGRPMHSWRVLILPFLEQQELYEKYDMSQPWDGPNNRKLAKYMPATYACPSHPRQSGQSNRTSYVAVVGDGTAWPHARTTEYYGFPDGLSHTIMVLEGDHDVPWMEPRDLTLDAAVALLSEPPRFSSGAHRYENFFFVEFVGRNVALADGAVQFLYQSLDRDIATQLLVRDDGGPVTDGEYEKQRGNRHGTAPRSGGRRLRVGNCLRLAGFVVLTVLPLPWVWLGRGRKLTPNTVRHSGASARGVPDGSSASDETPPAP
jgi:hypothetical protein